jgi:hypothetical protein
METSTMKHHLLAAVAAFLLLAQLATGSARSTPVATPAATAETGTFDAGWAVAVLDEPGAVAVAGGPMSFTLRVFDEGLLERPVEGAIVVLIARHAGSETAFAEIAHFTADPYRYEIEAVFDRAGTWNLQASIHNVGSMNPQITILPDQIVVDPGTTVAGATPASYTEGPGPAHLTIRSHGLDPWNLDISAGRKLLIVNESDYPMFFLAGNREQGQPVRIEPGETYMWYSMEPGRHLLTFGPAPAFMVAVVTIVDSR